MRHQDISKGMSLILILFYKMGCVALVPPDSEVLPFIKQKMPSFIATLPPVTVVSLQPDFPPGRFFIKIC